MHLLHEMFTSTHQRSRSYISWGNMSHSHWGSKLWWLSACITGAACRTRSRAPWMSRSCSAPITVNTTAHWLRLNGSSQLHLFRIGYNLCVFFIFNQTSCFWYDLFSPHLKIITSRCFWPITKTEISTRLQVRICSPSTVALMAGRWTAVSAWRHRSAASRPAPLWPSVMNTSYLRAPPTPRWQVSTVDTCCIEVLVEHRGLESQAQQRSFTPAPSVHA